MGASREGAAVVTDRWRFVAPRPAAPVEPGPVPTFSVIVAAYNVADMIGDALACEQSIVGNRRNRCRDLLQLCERRGHRRFAFQVTAQSRSRL